ncbi:AsmA-like C-terminal region-containing protein [Haliea sp. E1-2-M8]|uniref:AsmA family protein n=1 Tax=Haliea sp. E1-2-M8 TaxID=3064706 RepID=UPI00271C9C71|nr:AsmA-like C-terminal region-containing protein [Haliea sp. E1-2-M8]MDO8861846.1 AsmA-like C-terminal region-containing protein [Haliea sp. E1-2-M8]
MRKLWILPVALLVAPLAAGAALLSSPALLVPALQWGVERFTSFRLELKGLELRPRTVGLSLEALHLYQQGVDGPALISVLGFSGNSRLRDLWDMDFVNTTLSADSVIVYVAADDAAEDPTPEQWLQYLRFLPRQLDVATVHVINQHGDVSIFPVEGLSGRRTDSDGFSAELRADIDGAPLDVALALSSIRQDLDRGSVNFSADVEAPDSATRAQLEGVFAADAQSVRYDVTVNARFPQVSALLGAFPDAPPLAGNLSLRGRLTGDLVNYELSDAGFELDNRPAYYFEASGNLQRADSADPTLALVASGEMDSLAYFLRWLDLDLSPLGGIRASIALSGTLTATAVDQLTVVTQSSEGLWITLNGSSGPGSLGSTQLPAGADFTLHAFAPGLAALDPWLEQPIGFDAGPWQLSASLMEAEGDLWVRDIQAQLGVAGATLLRASGETARIDLDRIGDPAGVQGINMELAVASPDLSVPAGWLGQTVPPDFALKASAMLKGNGDELALTAGTGTILHPQLEIRFEDAGLRLHRAEDYQPLGGQASLRVQAPELEALSGLAGMALPDLGRVDVTAGARQRDQRIDLQDITASLAGPRLNITAHGSARDIAGAREVKLTSTVDHLDIDGLLALLAPEATLPENLGTLTGGFKLATSAVRYSLSDLALASPPCSPLRLRLDGSGNYGAEEAWQGQFALDFGSEDRALLEALSGLPLAPVGGSMALNMDPANAVLTSNTRVGDTELALKVEASHSGGTLTSLSASLESPLARLRDLGLQATGTEEEDYRPADKLEPVAEKTTLQRLLELAPRYPVDLRLALGSLQGDESQFDDIKVHLTGADTTYLLREFDFVYASAPAQIRGVIDISLTPPGLSIAGQAESIPLNTLSRDLGIETDISGSLNVRGGISAQGLTGGELLSQLDGTVGFALEAATIEGAAYDVLASGILTWLFSGAAREESTYLDCVMAQFSLEDGVARSSDIFIESPNMTARGVGEFNLPAKTLALTLTPRSKSRSIQIPSSISLRGDMASPRTSVSPVSTTLDITSEALLFLPRLVMRIFGFGKHDKTAQRSCVITVNP